MRLAMAMLKSEIRERCLLDSRTFRQAAARTGLLYAAVLRLMGQAPRAFRLLTRIHESGLSSTADLEVVRALTTATQRELAGQPTGLSELYDTDVALAVDRFRRSSIGDPHRLVGTRLLVVKACRAQERGILVADYNFIFPLLKGLFDIEAVASRYHLVLEPGWTGYCNPEILSLSTLDRPVFVQAGEPRDADFLSQFGEPFRAVPPLTTNWWCDYRDTRPLPVSERDIDVIMVAAWAPYKRHWRFFKALSALRVRGARPSVALVGYPAGMTQQDILEQARHFGVADQLEIHERVTPQAVSRLLSRSRVHVLWSRREGSNRAMIEALLADVPIIVRKGFNFGDPYAHVNAHTGRFADEDSLADTILELLDRPADLAPREWAMQNMTCQIATRIVEERVRRTALEMGEPWTEGPVVKVSNLDSQEYWNRSDRDRFGADYQFLHSVVRDH